MENEVTYLYLDDIIPNRFQPRENFNEQALKELAVSIKEHGVIQPIVVRKIGDKYEIIAGERRYKASTMAGLTKIPAIVRDLDDKESSKVALIENLQRKDLTPIEEARTYQKILELDALTQEELAKTMGKSQSAVSNKLRLLSLTDEVQDALLNEKISERHARSLLAVEDPSKQKELLEKIITTRMTVRELEDEIKNINGGSGSSESTSSDSTESGEQKTISEPYTDPTSVDINKLRSETKDINGDIEKIDIDNLLKPANVPVGSIIEPEEEKIDTLDVEEKKEEVKEPESSERSEIDDILNRPLPGFESKEEEKPAEEEKKEDVPILDINEEKEETKEEEEPKEEVKEESPISVSKPTTMQETVDSVKNSIQSIKDSGIKVDTEEFDFDDFYQIVIRIDKDNFDENN